jgi:hypothetical protein
MAREHWRGAVVAGWAEADQRAGASRRWAVIAHRFNEARQIIDAFEVDQ